MLIIAREADTPNLGAIYALTKKIDNCREVVPSHSWMIGPKSVQPSPLIPAPESPNKD
jgi:hypothetical protein